MENLIGKHAPDFELPGVDDQVHHLGRYLEIYQIVGVIFMSNCCSYVDLYLKRLKQIHADFHNQSFTLIGINANDASQSPMDSLENMKAFAAENELNFPYIRDYTQDVAHSFGVQVTPEAFLLDHSGIIRYCGGIDDYPQAAESVEESYLRNAIAQLLANQPVQLPQASSIGCSIKWRV